jgi:hypothetical protein
VLLLVVGLVSVLCPACAFFQSDCVLLLVVGLVSVLYPVLLLVLLVSSRFVVSFKLLCLAAEVLYICNGKDWPDHAG